MEMEISNLTPESINSLLMQVEELCQNDNIEKKEELRLRLTIEEALLKYVDAFGTDHRAELRKGGFAANNQIQLRIFCDKLDPLQTQDELGIMNSLMCGMDNRPRWRYGMGINIISFPMQKKKSISGLAMILIALVLGIGVGIICRNTSVNINSCEVLISDYLKPISDTYVGLLKVMAILMIFFAFPLSIVQAESLETFHGVTRRILLNYLYFSLIIIAIVALACVPGLNFSLTGTEGPNVIKSGLDVLLGFVPVNLIEPFLNFNCMQVLIVGLLFGFAFVAMGEKSRGMVRAFDSCNFVAVITNNYLIKAMPIYVAITAFSMAVQMNLEDFRGYMLIVYLVLACCVILPAIMILLVCTRLKVSPLVLCRKLMPSFIISLSSATIVSAFVTFYNEMNRDGGIETSYCTVSANLGNILFKPMYTAFFSITVFCMADMNGMTVTPIWVVLTFVLCLMLSCAVPGIPGGAAPVVLLLIGQMGFTDTAAQVAVALDVILQFIMTPVDIFCLQCLSFLLAAKEDKIDLEVLRRPL